MVTISTDVSLVSVAAKAQSASGVRLDLLPEDVTKLIFEAGYARDTKFEWPWGDRERRILDRSRQFAISVSHVCTHLRAIALSTTALWTFISSYGTRGDELHTLLARSTSAGLTIYVDRFHESMSIDLFFTTLCDVALRWKCLLVAADTPSEVYDRLQKLTNGYFPMLEDIFFDRYIGGFDEPDRETYGLFGSWKTPRLTSFVASAFPPNAINRLEAICIRNNGISPRHFPAQEFVAFHASLHTYSSLTKLDFNFGFNRFGDASIWQDYSFTPSKPLFLLTSLKVHDCLGDSDAVWKFLTTIQAPQLQKLVVDVPEQYRTHQELEELLLWFPSVEDLSINMGIQGAVHLSFFTRSLPRLRYLDVESLCLDQDEDEISLATITKLRSLHLSTDMFYRKQYLTAVCRTLLSEAHFEQFSITPTEGSLVSPEGSYHDLHDMIGDIEADNPGRVNIRGYFPLFS